MRQKRGRRRIERVVRRPLLHKIDAASDRVRCLRQSRAMDGMEWI